MSEVAFTLEECLQYIDDLIKRDAASTVDIAIKGHIERQRALIETTTEMVKDFVECKEAMSDLEFKVAVKMICKEWLKDVERGGE